MEQQRQTQKVSFSVIPDYPKNKSQRKKGQQRANRYGVLGRYNSKSNTYTPIKKLNILDYQKYPENEEDLIIGEPYRVDDYVGVWCGTGFFRVLNEMVCVSPKNKKYRSNPSCVDNLEDYPPIPHSKADRIDGKLYREKSNKIVIGSKTEKHLKCLHNHDKRFCEICDPEGHLAHNIVVALNDKLRNYIEGKNVNLDEYLAIHRCTLGFMINHIVRQFPPKMSLKNRSKWHIDHRKPQYEFYLLSLEDLEKCFHYTNLQPLWGPHNSSKGKTFDEKTFGWVWIDNRTGWVEKKSDMPIQIENDPDRSITFIPEPEEVAVPVLNENAQDSSVPFIPEPEEVAVQVLNENVQDSSVPFIPVPEEVAVPVLNENAQDSSVPFIPVPEKGDKPCMHFRLENVRGNCSVSYTFTSDGGEKSCVTVHLENVQGNCSGSFNVT